MVRDVTSNVSRAVTKGAMPSWTPQGLLAYVDGGRAVRLLNVKQDLSVVDAGTLFRSRADLARAPEWLPEGGLVALVRHAKGSLDCLEEKELVVRRLDQGTEWVIHSVCKSAPYRFTWLPRELSSR
jgi:hypothetical protein